MTTQSSFTQARQAAGMPARLLLFKSIHPRQRFPRALVTLALLAGTALGVAGCSGTFDVTNPNQLVEDDLARPEAASALANGAEATATRALAYLVLPLEVASDNLRSIGGYDAGRELDQGFVASTANEFTTNAFVHAAEARFSADEAIRRLLIFDAAGTLRTRADLARAYLYGGVVYTAVADAFDDFVISDRKAAAPPIGRANMTQLYDRATAYLDRGLLVARAVGRADLELAILAQRARAKHARAVRTLTRTPAGIEGDGFVTDAGAAADAATALALASSPSWVFQLRYAASTVPNQLASWVNIRQEFRPEDALGVPTRDNKQVESIRLLDPIDRIPDPVLKAAVEQFVQGVEYPPLTVVSARELHLIAAEMEFAAGDEAGAAKHVNAVRALDGLTPYAGQLPLADLLRHERRVNLFLTGRRLADQYRFRLGDPRWLPLSDAATMPGTLLPIPQVERNANCYLMGTCT